MSKFEVTQIKVGKQIRGVIGLKNVLEEMAKEFNIYTNKSIIEKFYDSTVTGSHIFNAIKMLKLRYDTLKIKDVTVDRIIESIQTEITVIEKVRKTSYLKDKYDRKKGGIGFGSNSSSDYEDEESIAPPNEVTDGGYIKIRTKQDKYC